MFYGGTQYLNIPPRNGYSYSQKLLKQKKTKTKVENEEKCKQQQKNAVAYHFLAISAGRQKAKYCKHKSAYSHLLCLQIMSRKRKNFTFINHNQINHRQRTKNEQNTIDRADQAPKINQPTKKT